MSSASRSAARSNPTARFPNVPELAHFVAEETTGLLRQRLQHASSLSGPHSDNLNAPFTIQLDTSRWRNPPLNPRKAARPSETGMTQQTIAPRRLILFEHAEARSPTSEL